MKKKKKLRAPAKKRLAFVSGCLLFGVVGLLAALYWHAGITGKSRNESETVPDSPILGKRQDKSAVEWSDAERKDVNSILLSYEEVQKTDELLAVKTPETLTTEDLRYIVRAFEKALSLAETVPDGILEKMHPEMKTQFRKVYQPGLRGMLTGFKNGDHNMARGGAELYRSYGAWVFSHAHELSFPGE